MHVRPKRGEGGAFGTTLLLMAFGGLSCPDEGHPTSSGDEIGLGAGPRRTGTT